MPEILRLVGTIKNKITKDRNGYNLTYNIVKKCYNYYKMRFPIEPRDRSFVKDHGFLSFAKKSVKI